MQLENPEICADQPRATRIELHGREFSRLRVRHRRHAGNRLLHGICSPEALHCDVLAHRQEPQVEILIAVAWRRWGRRRLAGVPRAKTVGVPDGVVSDVPGERACKRHHDAVVFGLWLVGLVDDINAFDAGKAEIDRAYPELETDRILREVINESKVAQFDSIQKTPRSFQSEL